MELSALSKIIEETYVLSAMNNERSSKAVYCMTDGYVVSVIVKIDLFIKGRKWCDVDVKYGASTAPVMMTAGGWGSLVRLGAELTL